MLSSQAKYGFWALGGVLAAAGLFSLSSRHEDGRKITEPPAAAQQEIERLREDVRQALLGDLSHFSAVMLEQAPGDNPLKNKMSQVQKAMDKRAKSDVPPIRVVLAMKKFESALKAGKTELAESALDLALKRLESAPGEDPLEKKLLRVRKGLKDLESKGGDLRMIGMTMFRLEPAISAGDESQAEATLDRALELLEAGGPAPRSSP